MRGRDGMRATIDEYLDRDRDARLEHLRGDDLDLD